MLTKILPDNICCKIHLTKILLLKSFFYGLNITAVAAQKMNNHIIPLEMLMSRINEIVL